MLRISSGFGSSNSKENDKETITDKLSSENNPAQKEHTHAGGGCCGGGAEFEQREHNGW